MPPSFGAAPKDWDDLLLLPVAERMLVPPNTVQVAHWPPTSCVKYIASPHDAESCIFVTIMSPGGAMMANISLEPPMTPVEPAKEASIEREMMGTALGVLSKFREGYRQHHLGIFGFASTFPIVVVLNNHPLRAGVIGMIRSMFQGLGVGGVTWRYFDVPLVSLLEDTPLSLGRMALIAHMPGRQPGARPIIHLTTPMAHYQLTRPLVPRTIRFRA